MAEVKRSRAGQSFINKPIGVVDVRTGVEKKYAAQADALSSVSNTLFNLTQNIQVKEGEEFAAKYKVRDENNNIRYEKIPFSLGRAGRAAAEKEVNKKYLFGLKQDAFQFATDLRMRSASEAEFSQGYSEWIKKRAQLVEQDAGADIASQFVGNSQQLMIEHSSAMKADAFKLEQAQSKAQYEIDQRNTIGHMKQAAASGDFEEASFTRDLILSSLDEDAIEVFKLSPEKYRDLQIAANDAFRDGVFQSITKDMSSSELSIIENAIESGNISEGIKKRLPELETLVQDFAADPQRAGTFNSFISGIREARSVAEKAGAAQVKFQYEMGVGLAERSEKNQKLFGEGLGFNTVLDAINADERSSEIEMNAAFPSHQSQIFIGQFADGALPEDAIIPALNRITEMSAAQNARGKNFEIYSGNKKAGQLAVALNTIREMKGDEGVVDAYRTHIEMQGNSSELLSVVSANSGYTIDPSKSDETNFNDAAYFYLNEKLRGEIPPHLFDEARGAVKYFLSMKGLDVKKAFKDYAFEAYSDKSRFYEKHPSGYSRYPDAPEYYLDEGASQLLEAKLVTISPGTDVFLKPMLRMGDAGVQWQAYRKNSITNRDEAIIIDGKPAIIDSRNFSKFNKKREVLSRLELSAMRSSKIDKREERSEAFMNLLSTGAY